MLRLGKASKTGAWQGLAWQGQRPGSARYGDAKLDRARQDDAMPGKVRSVVGQVQAMFDKMRLSMARFNF